MEKLTITIENLGNAAFEEDKNAEIARILRDLADKIENDNIPVKLRDINGNTVGEVEIN